MWEKNVAQRGMPHRTIRRMRLACWIPEATHPHTSCVILIAVPLQQWSHERTSVLRYTYIACLVNFAFINICLYTAPPSVVGNLFLPRRKHTGVPLKQTNLLMHFTEIIAKYRKKIIVNYVTGDYNFYSYVSSSLWDVPL